MGLVAPAMWDLPGSGIEPMSPALAGGFFTTKSTRKPFFFFFFLMVFAEASKMS